MIVGTSTGGIIAIAIGLLKMEISDVRKMYYEFGKEVFKNKRKLPAFYDSENVESILKKYLGTNKLSDYGVENGNPYVIACSCKANQIPIEPFLFTNFITNVYKNDTNIELWAAGRATSAAPVYFDPFYIGDDIFIDGAFGGNMKIKIKRK